MILDTDRLTSELFEDLERETFPSTVRESDEVAANIPVTRRLTWQDATVIVRNQMGTPEDVGYVIFDNVVESLVNRSKQHPRY